MSVDDWSEATRLVRGGIRRSGFDETAEAIYATSGFVYSSAEEAHAAFAGDIDRYIYGRYGNPTVSMFEERLRLIEGADVCRATASGMAAVFAAMASFLKAGDKVVAARALFGSCSVIITDILPRFGIETVLVDGRDLAQWEAALTGGAQAVFLETPSNPGLEIIDLVAVAELAHAAGALMIVDNIFATPVLQHPSNSAPTSWCIRRPSTSTVRGARSAVRCCAPSSSIENTFRTSCATPARASARSMRGPCSKDSRRSASGSMPWPARLSTSPVSSSRTLGFAPCGIRSLSRTPIMILPAAR
jgi:hypothetical protein